MSERSNSLESGGRRSRSARVAVLSRVAVRLAPPMIWLYACGGPQEGAGTGSECFRDADCVEGLICVEHACSNDVDGLVSTVEGPSGEEAAATEGTATSTSTSTGGPETSAASTDSASTSSGSTTTTGSTSGSGGTGATTTQGAAGAAGSP